jgi:hypothetical protein
MRSEAELEALDIDRNPAENKWASCLPIPAVTSTGSLTVTFLDRQLMRRGQPVMQGLAPIGYTAEMGVSLTRLAKAQRTVLYEDLCLGRVAGVEASPGHWKIWQRVCEVRASGRDIRKGALEQLAIKVGLERPYHPEVYRRRELVSDGGIESVDLDELLAGYGLSDSAADVDDLADGLMDDAPVLVDAKRRK